MQLTPFLHFEGFFKRISNVVFHVVVWGRIFNIDNCRLISAIKAFRGKMKAP